MARVPNLPSMTRQDCSELVWENGQLLVRALSSTAGGTSCISYTSQSPAKPQVVNDGIINSTKRQRLETVGSIFGDFPLLGLPGDGEVNQHDCSLQVDRLGLFETNFNMSMDDRHATESHVVPVYKPANLRSGNPSKFSPEIPEGTTPTINHHQLHLSSLKQVHQASSSFVTSMANVNQTQVSADELPHSRQQLDYYSSGHDKHLGLQNFSLFLGPAALPKADGRSSIGPTKTINKSPSSSRREQFRRNNKISPPVGSSSRLDLTLMEPPRGSKSCQGFLENQTADPEATTRVEPIRPIAEPPEEAAPQDEQSLAVAFTSKRRTDQIHGQNSENKVKGKPDTGKSIKQPPATTTSICSREASNCPTSRYEDTDQEMSNQSKINVSKEQVGATEMMPKARGSSGAKRRRTAEIHNLSEKRRRDKINKKMRALQELIPNSNKVDTASMLDEAIEHIKTLQRQLQIMSMGTGICMPPNPMLLRTGMQHVHAPQVAHFSPMGMGMGRRMHMGVGLTPLPFSTTAMLRLPAGQVQVPAPVPPFIPLIDGHSTLPFPVPLHLLGSVNSLLSPKDDVAQQISSGSEPSSQASEGSPN